MAVHLLIVDALNLIRRIHAVQGTPCKDTCLNALEQLIRHGQPTHVVAVFDDEARNTGWRHQLLPDYKAGRAPMPDDLHAEMPTIRAAFEHRGVPCWGAQGNEADDLAATLAIKVAGAYHQATIISTDKGYCQLLSPLSAFVIIFKNAGLMRRLSPASLAYHLSNFLTTGDLPASAVQKSRASRALVPKVPHSCWPIFRISKGFTRILMMYLKSGARSWRRIKRWRLLAGMSRDYRLIYS